MNGTILRVLTVASLTTSLAFFAGGCAKQQVRTDEAERAAQPPPQVQAPAPAPAPAESEPGIGAEEPLTSLRTGAAGTAAVSEGRTSAPMLPVYFAFDQSDIREDQQPRMKQNATFLKDNSQVSVRIEGNCDERGTNEYNMALGERRALSAKKYLMNLGITADRLMTISYGEEKPLVFGHDELSWAQNRRGDFVILN